MSCGSAARRCFLQRAGLAASFRYAPVCDILSAASGASVIFTARLQPTSHCGLPPGARQEIDYGRREKGYAMNELITDGIVWFQFASLLDHADMVTHGVFSRLGGVSEEPFSSLNAGPTTQDDPSARLENYRRISTTLPGRPLLVGTKPLQGSDVKEVTAAAIGLYAYPAAILPDGCDAFITRERGIGLFWAVADCSVILLVDVTHGAIGLTHAGWRGTRDAIVAKTISAMGEAYGTRPADLRVAIAPTIGPCCYEVDEALRREFAANPFADQNAHFSVVTVHDPAGGDRPSLRLDLQASNRSQLLACGVREEHIEGSDYCPGSRTDLFFSHRMEGGRTGRFAVVLGLA